MVRREGARVRCYTKNGHDWADRFPAIVAAALRIKAKSFLLDGEAVIPRADGMPDFNALRSQRRNHEALLYAFDLIEHDGDDLRGVALIDRKQRLAELLEPGPARHPIRRASGSRRRHCVRPRLPHGVGGHRVEADRCALSRRAVQGVAEVEEPGERGGAARARGRVGQARLTEVDEPVVFGFSSVGQSSGEENKSAWSRKRSTDADARSLSDLRLLLPPRSEDLRPSRVPPGGPRPGEGWGHSRRATPTTPGTTRREAPPRELPRSLRRDLEMTGKRKAPAGGVWEDGPPGPTSWK